VVEGTDTDEDHLLKRLVVECTDTEEEHMPKKLEVERREMEDKDTKGTNTYEGMQWCKECTRLG
jgi:hypothetical protein